MDGDYQGEQSVRSLIEEEELGVRMGARLESLSVSFGG